MGYAEIRWGAIPRSLGDTLLRDRTKGISGMHLTLENTISQYAKKGGVKPRDTMGGGNKRKILKEKLRNEIMPIMIVSYEG